MARNEVILDFERHHKRVHPNKDICKGCSARNIEYPVPYCGLGLLERDLKRIPTVGEAKNEGIKITRIPDNCPNRYLSLEKLPLSQRKIKKE